MIAGLLILLPTALLFASLILGRYPGEETLASARRPRRAPLPRARLALVPVSRPPARSRCCSRLVAATIAARPPPLPG